ncbi:MAG: ABC transporter permease [Candidatus Muiribacteriota bacterium]
MIKLQDIKKTYHMGEHTLDALKNVNIEIDDGELVAIMGPSGSGKSTLMNIIGFLDVPSEGKYIIDDSDSTKMTDNKLASLRNEKIGFVFQSFNLLPNLSAADNVELPIIYSGKKNRKELVKEALQKVDLTDRSHHKPRELSGGQQQRVAIARALVNKPGLILADEPTGALDSKTGKEIMNLILELNSHGITIIMVTHDPEVASYAHRVIELKDGEIIDDRRKISKKEEEENQDKSYIKKKKGKGVFLTPSEIIENISMAVYSIFSNKLRSFLTMLGVIIGVASVIGVVSITEGASQDVTQNISSMGANLVTITPGLSKRGPVRGGAATQKVLKYSDMEAIQELSPLVEKADANISQNSQVIFGNKNTNTSINGVTVNFPYVRNWEVERGTFFTQEENKRMERVAVIGQTVYKELFTDNYDPIGEFIRVGNHQFQIKGVFASKGSTGWRDEDDIVVIPLLTAQKRLLGVDYVSSINASIISNDFVHQAIGGIEKILRYEHNLRADQENDFTIRTQAEILENVGEAMMAFTYLLGGIAIISLVVGGIGIMNIMLVSVTERTREIGIRKAIGARQVDILMQFLIEAIFVSITGGIIGIGVGIGIGHLISTLADWNTVVSKESIILAFVFSTCVGLFFGFYPARKASKLNPIDALRYE